MLAPQGREYSTSPLSSRCRAAYSRPLLRTVVRVVSPSKKRISSMKSNASFSFRPADVRERGCRSLRRFQCRQLLVDIPHNKKSAAVKKANFLGTPSSNIIKGVGAAHLEASVKKKKGSRSRLFLILIVCGSIPKEKILLFKISAP